MEKENLIEKLSNQRLPLIGDAEKIILISALKKQIPAKPIIKPWNPAICPGCGAELSESAGDGYYKHWEHLKVCECGQLLDWENGAMRRDIAEEFANLISKYLKDADECDSPIYYGDNYFQGKMDTLTSVSEDIYNIFADRREKR